MRNDSRTLATPTNSYSGRVGSRSHSRVRLAFASSFPVLAVSGKFPLDVVQQFSGSERGQVSLPSAVDLALLLAVQWETQWVPVDRALHLGEHPHWVGVAVDRSESWVPQSPLDLVGFPCVTLNKL